MKIFKFPDKIKQEEVLFKILVKFYMKTITSSPLNWKPGFQTWKSIYEGMENRNIMYS